MNITEELERRVLILLAQNRKIEAIKLVVDHTHCGLKQAKDYVDNFNPADAFKAAPPVNLTGLDDQLLLLLANGNKLAAVKLYKGATRAGLAESKDYVESLQQRSFSTGIKSPLLPQQSAGPKRRDTQIDELVKNNGIKTKSGCFVATVCYGDYDAAEVLILRQFRDKRLMPLRLGRAFVHIYYAISPFLSRQIDKSVMLKTSIRKFILNPIVNMISR